MAKALSKSQIESAIAEKHNITKKQSGEILASMSPVGIQINDSFDKHIPSGQPVDGTGEIARGKPDRSFGPDMDRGEIEDVVSIRIQGRMESRGIEIEGS